MDAVLVAAAVRGAALLVLALLACAALREARASVRHAILAVALAGQIALPILELAAPRLEVTAPRMESGLPAADAVGRIASSPMTVGGAVALDEAGTVVRPELDSPRAGVPIVALLWLLGATALAARFAWGVRAARRLVAGARPAEALEWRSAAREAAVRAGRASPPPVLLSEEVSLPVTCGFVRTVVVLPAVAASWSRRRRVLVLTHEYAHAGRRDVLVQALARLACAAAWFDPLAWLALARLRAEAEGAADDAVLRSEPDAGAYVRELVGVLRSAIRERGLGAEVGLGLGLESRARRAVAARPRAALSRAAAAGLVGAALLATAAIASITAARADGPALATGCVYSDGRHVNRWAEIDGTLTWQVLWEGPACEVELRARPDVALVDGILVPVSAGGEVEARIARAGSVETLTVRRRADGSLAFGRAAAAPNDPAALAARLRGLAREIDRHTGFDAEARVPALLAAGGVDAVLAAARETEGDHAAGVVLLRLLDVRRLTEAETARALEIAAERVSSDAVLETLLLRIAGEADVSRPALREPFARALVTLESRAARAAVEAAIP